MYRLCNLKKLLVALFLALFAVAVMPRVEAGESVTLSWDSNPETDIAGYRVCYGQYSGILDETADTGGTVTEMSISGLIPGETYYFAVLAYNQQGIEGPLSNEISYTVPLPEPETPPLPPELPELAVESSVGGFLIPNQAMGPEQATMIGKISTMGTITLHNRGKARLSGLAVSLSGSNAFSTSNFTTTALDAGATTTLTVDFAPKVPGQQFASLRISSNDPTRPQFDIALAGNGTTSPRIAVSGEGGTSLQQGASLAFGNLELGTATGRVPLTLRNVGNAPLNGLQATIRGSGAADFSHSSVSVTSLAPGAETLIEVIFHPTAAGSSTATLDLAGDDPSAGGFQLTLTGTALSRPRIELADSHGDALSPGKPAVAPSVLLGKSGAALTYTITNSGTAPLSGIRVAATGADAASFIATQPLAKSLAPGASTTFSVTFQPLSGGWSTAKLLVSGNGDVLPREISLKGMGTTAPVLKLTDDARTLLTPSGRAMDFGTLNLVDKAAKRSITLKNTGSAPLRDLKLTCSGPAAADFILTTPKSSSLAPGASVRIPLGFSPSAAGLRLATVTVSSNEDGPPREFAVSGIGIAAPELDVRLGKKEFVNGKAYIDFGKGQIGAKGVTETIILTNSGSATLKNLKVVKDGISPDEFDMSRVSGRDLAAGKSIRLKVTFRARKRGIRWAGIRIANSNADEKNFEIILTGTGTTDKVKLRKNKAAAKMKSAAAAPLAAPAPIAHGVEGIEVIDGRKYRTLTVSRASGVTVTARDIEVSSDRVEWASGGRHTSVLRDNADWLVVRDNTPLTQTRKRFIRIH